MTQNVNREVLQTLIMVAERGWRAHLVLSNGEEIKQIYITLEDFENGAFAVERVGERHLKPRLLWVKDVVKVTPDWS